MNIEDTQSQNENKAITTVGQQLRQARERLGLGVKDIAEQLHLKLTVIKDIEDDVSLRSLAPTFVRGYIRAYAKLVNIPLDQLLPIAELPETQPHRTKREMKTMAVKGFSLAKKERKKDLWVTLITWSVVIILLGISFAWWWQNYKQDKKSVKDLISAEAPVKTSSGEVPITLEHQSVSTSNNRNVTQNNQTLPHDRINKSTQYLLPVSTMLQSQLPKFPNQTAQLSAEGKIRYATLMNTMYITFTTDSWVTIIDSSGKRLFNGLQRKGAKLEINGKPPYRVRLGVAQSTIIKFKDKEFGPNELTNRNFTIS